MKRLLVALLALTMIGASAADPIERLADPVKEARARHLFKQLRCLMCQNESIDDSTASIAGDLRRTVRERLTAGDTDQQALDYLEERYSQYVLLKPPFTPGNLVLWLGPFAVLVIAGGAMGLALRRKSAAGEPLGEEEAAALAGLLDENPGLPDENPGLPDENPGLPDENPGLPDENNAQIAPKIGRKKPASPS